MRTSYEKDGQKFKMRKGKEIAQACHASMKFLVKKTLNKEDITEAERYWLENKFTKICVQVEKEDDLFALMKKAELAGLNVQIVQDCGLTEFNEPTYTCLAIGPDYAEKIDPITKDLKLY